MALTLVSIACAFVGSLYWSSVAIWSLKLDSVQAFRLLFKSVNLSLCYIGFQTRMRLSSSFRAAKAAAFCAAYDHATDDAGYSFDAHQNFFHFAQKHLDTACLVKTQMLYAKELEGRLERDGLVRGSVALELILRVMGVEQSFCQHLSIECVGEFLQIVDDLIDLEHDTRFSETNCILSQSYAFWLNKSATFNWDAVEKHLTCTIVLSMVVRKAQEKARELLAGV